jgi:DNA-binding PadR family transcriptional regulator
MSKESWMSGGWPWGGFAFGPSRFFEAGRRARFFETGEIRLAILSLLSEGPKHGYQLMKELADRSGGVYRASAGSVYPTLQQLEDEGLIECTQEGGRRVYRLTEAGRAELARDPEAVRRIWERAEHYENWGECMANVGPDGLTLFAPLSALARASFLAVVRAGSRPEGVEWVRQILDRARLEVEQVYPGKKKEA